MGRCDRSFQITPIFGGNQSHCFVVLEDEHSHQLKGPCPLPNTCPTTSGSQPWDKGNATDRKPEGKYQVAAFKEENGGNRGDAEKQEKLE